MLESDGQVTPSEPLWDGEERRLCSDLDKVPNGAEWSNQVLLNHRYVKQALAAIRRRQEEAGRE